MAISNLSTGLRPGVCTSTTRPTAPFEGQMIYETDTNRVLVYEGAAWVMIADTDSPPGLELVKTQTVGTTVASVTVSDCFSSTYDNYKITVNGCLGSVDSNLLCQLSGITGTVYNQLGHYQQWGTAAPFDYAALSTVFIAGNTNSNPSSMDVEIKNPFLSVRKFGIVVSQNANNQYTFPFYINSTTSATGFTLTPGSGTMTGGTIRVYGYRNTI